MRGFGEVTTERHRGIITSQPGACGVGRVRPVFVFGALVWEIYDCDILHIIFIAKLGLEDDTLPLRRIRANES